MEEARGKLLYLPRHRERPAFSDAEHLTTPETASQETLQKLFDQMVDVAAMPTEYADKLFVEADEFDDGSEREIVFLQLSQRQSDGLAFVECVDSVILVRQDGQIAVVDYTHTYYKGEWGLDRRPHELQHSWRPEYKDGSLGVVDATFTESIAQQLIAEAAQEINRRAQERRLRYMVGVVAMTPPVS